MMMMMKVKAMQFQDNNNAYNKFGNNPGDYNPHTDDYHVAIGA